MAPASAAPPAAPSAALPHASEAHPDEIWLTQVYQGEHVPQLTVRALVMGALIGMLMSVSNLYTSLKVGWSFGVALTACVISFVAWNGLRALSGNRLAPMSILENNCMQSTASSAGYSTGVTLATCFGALLILDPQHRHLSWMIIAAFLLASGALGVFLAVPMKRQLINREQLAFPSGVAAATLLRSLYAQDRETLRQARVMIGAIVTGAVVGVLNTAEDQFAALGRWFAWMRLRLFDVHLPDLVPAQGFGTLAGRPLVAFGFEPSALLIAAGMIVGLRVSLSMFAASALLYLVVAPWLQALDAANAAVPGYLVSLPAVAGGTLFHPVRWALWGGVSLMVFASFTALALQWRTVVRSLQLLRAARSPQDAAADGAKGSVGAQMEAIEVPLRWFVLGIIPIGLALVAVQIIAFGVQWWAGLIAVAMSFLLALVACRAAGETDIAPIGPLGKLMQLLFAVLSPGNLTHNLVAAGAGVTSASTAADLLTDLKSGYLLGAHPRRQFLAQLTGVFFGTLAIVPAWYLMIPDVAALEKYPLPATQVWVATARILSAGVDSLPLSARIAILCGALVGIALPLLEKGFPRARSWMPSAIGLGLGWVVFFSNTLSFAIGGLVVALWGALHRRSQERYSMPLASGLIAGESLIKALLAMLATGLGLVAS